ncbi:MAG: TonB-dependent receptor, partial [bacterium]
MQIHRTLTAAALVALAGTTAAAQQKSAAVEQYRMAGFVADTAGRGVPFAEVVVAIPATGAQLHARTDSAGHFVVPSVPAGQTIVQVHRLGFEPLSRHLAVRGAVTDSLLYTLMPLALGLASVDVHDTLMTRGLREFLDRKRMGGMGRFIDQEAIDSMHITRASDALRMVPGVQLRPSGRIGNLVRIRGCKPTLWVNGVRAAGAELDELAQPDDIGGIEVYNSLAGMPPQYQDRQNPCGAILIWSRGA